MTQAMFRVLVVEDDEPIRAVLRVVLESAGYRLSEAENAARALVEARSNRPDLILMDLGLPDRDGQQLIRDIRKFSNVPILVLSARTSDSEIIAALDGGADDYVIKPFQAGPLLARVRAALRRKAAPVQSPGFVAIGRLRVDLARREAIGPNGPEHLTPLEYRLLQSLLNKRGLVVRHEELIREAWGPGHEHDSRGLRSYVRMLRRKMEPDPGSPTILRTEPGIGYRLTE